MSKSGDTKNTLYCSFCGKSQHEVRKLIAGPTVFICDECVDLCSNIVHEEKKKIAPADVKVEILELTQTALTNINKTTAQLASDLADIIMKDNK